MYGRSRNSRSSKSSQVGETKKTRVQVMVRLLSFFDKVHEMQRFSLKDLNVIQILKCSLCCARFVNWAARSSSRTMEQGHGERLWSWIGYNRFGKFRLVLYKHSV